MNNWFDANLVAPHHEPNTDGKACVVIGESGNVYRARYMHDYEPPEVDTKYWSEFTFCGRGVENEHYEINEKIVLWQYLPE